MAKIGSVLVAMVALMLGVFVGYVGLTFLLGSGDFASAQSESRSFLGIFGESSSDASVPVQPWIGLVFLLGGGALLMFGLRALFVAFEGRSDLG